MNAHPPLIGLEPCAMAWHQRPRNNKAQPFELGKVIDAFGGSAGTRTRDQRIKSPLLYQLSYRPQARYYGFLDFVCQIE